MKFKNFIRLISLLLIITNSAGIISTNECSGHNYPQKQGGECKCIFDEKTRGIICCNLSTLEELCIHRGQTSEAVRSLTIGSSNLPHLSLTYGLIKKLNIDLHAFERLRITQASIHNVNICSLNQENTIIDASIVQCQNLTNLQILDLRDNKLTTLEEFRLPLEELYLSGNHLQTAFV